MIFSRRRPFLESCQTRSNFIALTHMVPHGALQQPSASCPWIMPSIHSWRTATLNWAMSAPSASQSSFPVAACSAR